MYLRARWSATITMHSAIDPESGPFKSRQSIVDSIASGRHPIAFMQPKLAADLSKAVDGLMRSGHLSTRTGDERTATLRRLWRIAIVLGDKDATENDLLDAVEVLRAVKRVQRSRPRR